MIFLLTLLCENLMNYFGFFSSLSLLGFLFPINGVLILFIPLICFNNFYPDKHFSEKTVNSVLNLTLLEMTLTL